MSCKAVVTVDGPAGAGKGTLASALAKGLGWQLLDSGAIYRAAALGALKAEMALDDEQGLASLIQGLCIRFENEQVFLNDEEVSSQIRNEACASATSKIAALPAVRAALLELQRSFQTEAGLIADGRDMGTVVFPQADAKIFLTASAEVRGQRRHKQLIEQGISANLADLIKDISARDERDANRKVAPLKPAADALVLDSSDLSIEQVIEKAQEYIKNLT